MNRSKIEWCDHTWNPITGCRHKCPYCYAERMTKRFAGDVRLNLMAKKDYRRQEARDGGNDLYVLDKPMMNETGNPLVYPFDFEPTFHSYRLDVLDKLKMGNNIFVGAMTDMFGEWVPDDWIYTVLMNCFQREAHNYMFLTKNPKRYAEWQKTMNVSLNANARPNMWFGTTVTGPQDADRIQAIADAGGINGFLSIEPVLEKIDYEMLEPYMCNRQTQGKPYKYDRNRAVSWVILGAETGNRKNKVVPPAEWIYEIVRACDEWEVPVFMKDSLIPVVGEKNMRRELPKRLQISTVSPKMRKKLYSSCAGCKLHLKKKEMVTLLARFNRGEQAKQFGFLCKDCFDKLCGDFGLDAPEPAKHTDRKDE